MPDQRVEAGLDEGLQDGLEKLVLGLEVQIGEALADAGAGGDVFKTRTAKTLFRELLQRRLDNFLRTLVLAACGAAARMVGRCRGPCALYND